ncbi:MAG: acyl carrier protein [Phycisphaera sp.]|nr:acyl carrier protein [Phycisphaera sp.]
MSQSTEPRQLATDALTSAIDELNTDRADDKKLDTSPDTVLFGIGGSLDSMDLVRLVVLFEQKLAEADEAVSIADERAMSQRNSPFRTVQALGDYAATLIQERRDG